MTGDLLGGAEHLVRVIVTLIGLGLVMAFSPTTFGIEIGTLDRPGTARRQVLVIAGAVAGAATLLAGVFLVVSPNTLSALATGRVRTLLLQRWLDATVGLALIIVGLVRWRRSSRPPAPHPTRDLTRPRILAGMVFAESLVSASGPATMYLVVRSIGTLRPVLWPLAYAVFLAALAAPYLLLAVAWAGIPSFARRVSAAMARISRFDLRRPIAGVLVAVGLGLIIWAGYRLVSAG